MVTCPDGIDSKAGLLCLAGPSISREIRHHFTDMTSFRLLRSGDRDSIGQKRKRHNFLESGAPHKFDVSLEDCTTRVVSCIQCRVLLGYCVLWAESALRVRTCGAGEHTPGDMHTLRLLTMHIVDLGTTEEGKQRLRDRSPSFALQSVSQPDRAEQLECYPRHMIHFGYLMHAHWNNNNNNNNNNKSAAHVPHRADTAVLILGLGGNVIGNYLNAALPPDVPMDVVELEPAVFDTCRQQQQVPQLSRIEETGEQAKADTGTGTGIGIGTGTGIGSAEGTAHACDVWSVGAEHERHGHYRFLLCDARDALRHRKGPLRQQYSIVFLDCYDPEREQMMHDGDLVDLCRERLCPGGALVVNAHILPKREELDAQFLSRGFASVQALRVGGCNQAIIVCLAPGAGCGEGEFGVRQVRQMARENSGQIFRNGFSLDADWLKSSRAIESGSATAARVWEHYE